MNEDIQKLCLHLYRVRLRTDNRQVAAAVLQCLALMEPFTGATPPSGVLPTLTPEEAYEVQSGRLIQAIKMVRERLNLGLRDAKDMVDHWVHHHAVPQSGPSV